MLSILRKFCPFLIVFATACSFAQADTVYLSINNVLLNFNDGQTLQRKTFNATVNTEPSSSFLFLNENQPYVFIVANVDSLAHRFQIGSFYTSGLIQPNDSVQIEFPNLPVGVHRYFDPSDAPLNEYVGLTGMIHVKGSGDTTPYFYWNIQEHASEWEVVLNQGNTPDWSQYNPDYFTINGKSDPDINTDTLARITGNVGQELRIVMMNNGLSIHSMHFHGYHAELIQSTQHPDHVGRLKDTFPLYPKEFIVLRLVPDKPGEYPIHDHNLVAVTGGGVYHAGMFTTILITP
jgi:FtsP/CotA-like multicopper oxidase with cupredoxin domain